MGKEYPSALTTILHFLTKYSPTVPAELVPNIDFALLLPMWGVFLPLFFSSLAAWKTSSSIILGHSDIISFSLPSVKKTLQKEEKMRILFAVFNFIRV